MTTAPQAPMADVCPAATSSSPPSSPGSTIAARWPVKRSSVRVLTVIAYDDEDDAIRIANDSEYGLGGTVWSPDHDHAVAVATRIHSGTVGINRELGPEGLQGFANTKSIFLS
jgi:Aldehyde dehydrogenase family